MPRQHQLLAPQFEPERTPHPAPRTLGQSVSSIFGYSLSAALVAIAAVMTLGALGYRLVMNAWPSLNVWEIIALTAMTFALFVAISIAMIVTGVEVSKAFLTFLGNLGHGFINLIYSVRSCGQRPPQSPFILISDERETII